MVQSKVKCAAMIAFSVMFSVLCACNPQEEKKTYVAPIYSSKQLTLTGWWAPEPTKEAYELFKEAGMNTLLQVNHSAKYLYDENGKLNRTTDNTYFLGSNISMRSLELCREVGLDAIVSYGGWYGCENYPTDGKVFSARDVYGEYKDIIKGVHIVDEPYKEKIDELSDPTFIQDFKDTYPTLPFMCNLHPSLTMQNANYFGMGLGATYEEYVDYFTSHLVEPFENNRYLSVDVYPFEQKSANDKYLSTGWLYCYETVANAALQYGADLNYYIQTVWGGENAKQNPRMMTTEDIRLHVYMSLAYGGNSISYYCYSMPTHLVNGEWEGMYKYCMLDIDGNPTPLYQSVKEVNGEISAFDDAFLSYQYKKTYPIFKEGESKSRTDFAYLSNQLDIATLKRVQDVSADGEVVMGVFEDEKGEQGYMLVNYSDTSKKEQRKVTLTLKDSEAVAVYGGKGYQGTPTIVYAEGGVITLTISEGNGMFVVPFAK